MGGVVPPRGRGGKRLGDVDSLPTRRDGAAASTEGRARDWLVDPDAKTVEVLLLEGSSYRLLDIFEGSGAVSAPPFDAVPLELAALWAR